MRDETHRFATSRNQRLRTKENVVSAFAALPGIGAKRERILTQKFVTIENLAKAQEAQVAQALGIKADKAAEILMQARRLSQERNQKKEAQMQSLKEAGTTKEIAAHNEWIAQLADEA